jgi:parvulin-like peptidyl-prolyl isomerase
MSVVVRAAITALLAAVPALPALGQATSAAKTQTPKATAGPIVATVNGEPIYLSEVESVIVRNAIPAGEEKQAYDETLKILVNTHLLTHFLKEKRIEVSKKEIDEEQARLEALLKREGNDLGSYLARSGVPLEEVRSQLAQALQWKKYLTKQASESELRKYVAKNKDRFNGTEVRASHILISLPPDAASADKEKARQKLLDIKKEIESGKISFADAANKYSDDVGNKETPNGGDLQYFPRKGRFVEPFSAAAFALSKGAISDPVETEFGWHLIEVTDRREGKAIDFEQFKDQIMTDFGYELQLEIVEAQRKLAKIETKPMPAGFMQRPGVGTGAATKTELPKR